MAYKNENGIYSFPGLITGGGSLISLTDLNTLSIKAKEVLEESTPVYNFSVEEEDQLHSCLVVARNGETGKFETGVASLADEKLVMFDTKNAEMTSLRPTLTIDCSLTECGITVGKKAYDPECPALGKWIAVSDNELINCDDTFGTVPLFGDSESIMARAKEQMHEKVKDEMEKASLQSRYNDLNETLESKGLDFYIDEEEKKTILDDLRSGWKLAEEVDNVGGAKRVAEKVRETTIEFAEEFKTHATKFSGLIKGFGSRVKDFFKSNKEEPISASDMADKGIDEETADAIRNEAEKRQESKFSLRKIGKLAKEKMVDLKTRGIEALAGIAKTMSDLKIDHFERMQAKEEKHIAQAMEKIKKRAEKEHNAKEAEQRLLAFVNNVGRVVSNVGIAALNAGIYVASGNLTEKLAGNDVKFDGISYKPMIHGKDVDITRSSFSTNMYRSYDNRIIDSALSLGQIKAKLFNERLAAVPMSERKETADRLIGEMAKTIGTKALEDRKIDYVNIEGFPGKHVGHTIEFTKDGIILDGENLSENGFRGVSEKMSPNAMMHLFVEVEKVNIVEMYKEAELGMSTLVQGLNKSGERTAVDIAEGIEHSDSTSGALSNINKTSYDTANLLKGEYTHADVLADKAAREAEFKEKDAAFDVEI